MLDHITVGVSDFQKSVAFYDQALAPLGLSRHYTVPHELAGGQDNGAPGLRPHYHRDYYGAFVLDPDGFNIEAVFHGGRTTGPV
jgi:catechol 2,3-dioxygenase-like lactoylglutathione lyase family enzyme